MYFTKQKINDCENGDKSKTAASPFPAGPKGDNSSPKIVHDVFVIE